MTVRAMLLGVSLVVLAACGRNESGMADGGSDTATQRSSSDLAQAGAPAPYREGQHYERLETPIDAADHEVVEVFSYACPACAQFQPEVDTWKRERGDAVALRYVPAEFHPTWVPFARAYHTLQTMGALGRAHRVVFDALYRQGTRATTLPEIADIVASAGVDPERFLATAQSPEVDAAMQRSRDYVRTAKIGSTPTLIVAGRYRVVRQQPGDTSPLDVADWLLKNRP